HASQPPSSAQEGARRCQEAPDAAVTGWMTGRPPGGAGPRVRYPRPAGGAGGRWSPGAGAGKSAGARCRGGWAGSGTCGAAAARTRCWNPVSPVASWNASRLSQWATLTSWNRAWGDRARCSRVPRNPGLVLISAARSRQPAMNSSMCWAGISNTLISVTGELLADWLSWLMKSPIIAVTSAGLVRHCYVRAGPRNVTDGGAGRLAAPADAYSRQDAGADGE